MAPYTREEEVVSSLLWWLRRWRWEVAVATTTFVVLFGTSWCAAQLLTLVGLSHRPSTDLFSGFVFCVAVTILVCWRWPFLWPELRERLDQAHIKRRLGTGLNKLNMRGCRARRCRFGEVRRLPSGWSLRVRVPAGASVQELMGRSGDLATAMRVAEVQIRKDSRDSSWVLILVLGPDSLSHVTSQTWPPVSSIKQLRLKRNGGLFDPIPVGCDVFGAVAKVTLLPAGSMLIGGAPRAGKTMLAKLILIWILLMRRWSGHSEVVVTILDGKGLDYVQFRPDVDNYVGGNPLAVVAGLEAAVDRMNARAAALSELGQVKVGPADSVELMLWDEFDRVLMCGDKGLQARAHAAIRDLLARGPALGTCVVMITQRPSSDVVPLSIRDLLSLKFAARTNSNEGSDVILGPFSRQGISAQTIDLGTPGVGFLLTEGDLPVKIKIWHLDDAQIAVALGEVRQ